MDNLALILWIFAYSLSGAVLILGFISWSQNKRREILSFLFWNLNMFLLTVITLLYTMQIISSKTFTVIFLNSLLFLYLTIPALIHCIHKRVFPFIAYLIIYLTAAISLDIVLFLDLDISPWFYYIWWLPLTIALTVLISRSSKIEGDNEKGKPFFRSIFKISYLSIAVPIFMNSFIYLVFIMPGKATDQNITILYSIFYCLFNIPGLVYFLNYHIRKKDNNTVEPDPEIYGMLSEREKEITDLLIKGKKYREIGDQLCISMSTVKKHTNNIYRKTGTSSARLLIRKLMKS